MPWRPTTVLDTASGSLLKTRAARSPYHTPPQYRHSEFLFNQDFHVGFAHSLRSGLPLCGVREGECPPKVPNVVLAQRVREKAGGVGVSDITGVGDDA